MPKTNTSHLGLRIGIGLAIVWGFIVLVVATGTPYISDFALRYVTQDEIDRTVDTAILPLAIFGAVGILHALSEIAAMNRIQADAKAQANESVADKFRANPARGNIAPDYIDTSQIPVDTEVDKSNAMKVARDNDEDNFDATRDKYPRA